jgi:radical SAM superfamily enzyme YgiQ (UPF0313 family)
MILHCAPPYEACTPNAAIGYLKGYLQKKGIKVNNVYWNLIIDNHLHELQQPVKEHAQTFQSLPVLTTLYVARCLLDPAEYETPFHLLYTAAFTKEEIVDRIGAIKEDIDHYIRQNNLYKDTISGFTLKTLQWPINYYVMKRLKEFNPALTVVIGGIRDKSQALEFMRIYEADYAVWGEGEIPLALLASALEKGTSLEEVPQLVYRTGKTLAATTDSCARVPLDSFPFADHADYFATYEQYPYQLESPITIPIWGSRGCFWHKCNFCDLNENYTYGARSPENIVAEIEYQSKKYDVENFIFVDNELAGTKKRFKTLLNLLLESSSKRKIKYYIFAEIIPIFMNPEIAHLMQLVTFHQVQIGFEAMTDALLEKMCKIHRFAYNIQAVKLGNVYNLKIDGLNIIRGIPTETKEDIVESCENLRFLRFYLNQITLNPSLLMLYKGAPFYKGIPPDELLNWKDNPFYYELSPLNVIPDAKRFEFFGFYNRGLDPLWRTFENLLALYTEQPWSYTWVEYPDSSRIEEKGPTEYEYGLTRDETDLLIFCDTVKSFREVKENFSHSEKTLCTMMESLKSAGLLYYDDKMHTIISVLEAEKRKVLADIL